METETQAQNSKVLSDLGEVKGMLRGVSDMIAQSNAATNRRIDDLTHSINRRVDVLEKQVATNRMRADNAMELATDVSARVSKHSAFYGGGAGALVGAGIELLKLAFWNH